MREFITGAAIGLVLGMCALVYGLNDANQDLQASNAKLMDKIIDIQTEQAKQERVAERAMRRKVRKIAAEGAGE